VSSEAVREFNDEERVETTEETKSFQAGKPPSSAQLPRMRHSAKRLEIVEADPLLTADEVAARLNVTKDWVWDHSSRKTPLLPVIRLGDGTLRYRSSRIEGFINEMERLSVLRRKRR
jgi:predicted DNA-binding transcriptional regulator AlpA